MILIQSTHEDSSTTDVIRWLIHYDIEFIRLNDHTKITDIEFENNMFRIEFNNRIVINSNEITAYWYRRGDMTCEIVKPDSNFEEFNLVYSRHLSFEKKTLLIYFLHFLKHKIFCIGDMINCLQINKLIVLDKAKKCNLLTPKTIITTNKKKLLNFFTKENRIITKSIDNTFQFEDDAYRYITRTEVVKFLDIKRLPEHFEVTQFQEEIQKQIEIRAFYLLGKFYSMAIFSQNDPKTKVDFRNYNTKKPNRTIPFKLPVSIENKLHKLMVELQLESGSIDLIYSTEKLFYFLEINPIGQFGVVSYFCNYQLEKKIALHFKENYELSKKNNKLFGK